MNPTPTNQTSTNPPPLLLPGQTYAAPGPLDMTGMYVAHHGFRRDLADFEQAVRNTPVGDAEVWRLLGRRWAGFAEVLHHHHGIEDDHYWPGVLRQAEAAGDTSALATLASMEAEHDLIDPALAACESGFAAMVEHPCPGHRDQLDSDVSRMRVLLAEHLRHEETLAIPLLQRLLPLADFEEAERAALSTFPKRLVPFVIGWGLHRLNEEGTRRMLALAGRGYALVHRLVRRSWAARERRTFRYV